MDLYHYSVILYPDDQIKVFHLRAKTPSSWRIFLNDQFVLLAPDK